MEGEPAPRGRTFAGRFTVRDGVRRHVARGTLINSAFLVGVTLLGFLKGFVVAAFLTADDYGIWGIVIVSLTTLTWLAQSGVGDKYVQQDDGDQVVAFQKAFTLELMFVGLFTMVVLALIPVIVLAYGRDQLLLPLLLLATAFPAGALRSPVWVFSRQMRFVRMRVLTSVEPVVGFVTTVALAAAGAGYWSLVVGFLAGAWSAAIVSVLMTPYPLRLRYDSGTLRRYASFTWPLLIYGANGLVIAQVSVLVGSWELGLAAVGAISLTANITQFTDRVDEIVTGALYPAICAVKDRTDLLFESFVKSNRLALMWGVPFGVGVALFADDLVHFALGEKWRIAVPLLQAFGLIAAANHIGFNWQAFYRARGQTRPLAVVSGLMALAFLCSTVPFMILWGLNGFAAGMATITVVGLGARAYYLTKLFPGFRMLRHILRAISPTVPAAAAVLAVRLVEGGPERSLATAFGVVLLYLVVTVIATIAFERPLLREVMGYLRRQAPLPAAVAGPGPV